MNLEKEFEDAIKAGFQAVFHIIRILYIGIKETIKNRKNIIIFITWVLIGTALILTKEMWWQLVFANKLNKVSFLRNIAGFIPPFFYLYYKGERYETYRDELEKKFMEIGFYSGLITKRDIVTGREFQKKNVPLFISKEIDGKKIKYKFRSNIPLMEWKNKYREIETVLDLHIVKVEPAKHTKQIVTLHTVPASQGINDYVPWSNEYIRMDEDKFELVCGVSMLSDVIFDLTKLPHMLIAGLTGSGKSVLETCLAWQAIRKGAQVVMIDFKGGIEYGRAYEKFGEVLTERNEVIETLEDLVEENSLRLVVFRREGVRNLEEYNKKFPNKKLTRVIILCDEIGEMLDTSGVDKETKKQMDHISHLMSTLARLGRAPGINLILATQRPDAKVLCGQIKANLPIRISGIMVDDYNSEMVLGNTKAVEINPDIKGRFMYSQGVETHEFQAYAFNPSFIETGKYRIGKMLIDSPEAAGMNRQSVKEIDEPETNQYRDIFKAKQIEAEQKAEIPEKDTKENENINAAGDPATVWNGLKVKGFN